MSDRRKELKQAYREKRPEMGILYARCLPTNDLFLTPATDIPGKINSLRFQLSAGNCPNKNLQNLWKEQGADAFEWGTERELEYKDLLEDHKEDLEILYELAVLDHPDAERISRSM